VGQTLSNGQLSAWEKLRVSSHKKTRKGCSAADEGGSAVGKGEKDQTLSLNYNLRSGEGGSTNSRELGLISRGDTHFLMLPEVGSSKSWKGFDGQARHREQGCGSQRFYWIKDRGVGNSCREELRVKGHPPLRTKANHCEAAGTTEKVKIHVVRVDMRRKAVQSYEAKSLSPALANS